MGKLIEFANAKRTPEEIEDEEVELLAEWFALLQSAEVDDIDELTEVMPNEIRHFFKDRIAMMLMRMAMKKKEV